MADPLGPIDPFTKMNMEASNHKGENARISVTVQQSLAYGEVKCSFTVTVSCPQTQQWMDHASKHAFAQAVQYVNDGMSWLAPGLPPLTVPILK